MRFDCAFKLQVKGLLTWVRKEKQIYIHTYIHTLFVKQLQETGRAPGLKRKGKSIEFSVVKTFCLPHHAANNVMQFFCHTSAETYYRMCTFFVIKKFQIPCFKDVLKCHALNKHAKATVTLAHQHSPPTSPPNTCCKLPVWIECWPKI